jgi:hypothetical protein
MSRSFFERSKKYLARLEKTCLERKPTGYLRPGLGPAGKRRFLLANGISTESHQNTAIYQPGTTNPGDSSKDDKPTPTNPQGSGRTIRPRNYLMRRFRTLEGLDSVPSRRCVIILAVGSLTTNAHVYSGTENSLKKAASLNQDSVWAAPRRWEA